jgi:autotransporter-associated beta strand protein
LNGLAVANVSPSSNSVATTSAGDIFTVGGTGTITNGGANVTLNVGGPGTVVLATANTYAGKWSFNSGTNQISNAGALGTGPNAHINAGAILDAAPLGASVTFAPTVSAISANGTGTAVGSTAATLSTDPTSFVDLTNKTINLTFTPSLFTGDTTHPSLYMSQGTLALGNNAFFVNNASGTALGVGTYRLIQSAGSIINGGGYAVVVTGSGMASGNTGTIVVSGGNVDLVVAPYVPKNLVWTGGSTALWDNGTSVSWLNGATPSVFNTSDTVLFNSVGSTNPTATLTGTLAPASATVDTTANNYTLSGAGQIGGSASLTKIGTGVLTVSTANSYTGGTTVSNGVLRLGANNAIPSTGSGALAVASPGSVDLNNFNNTVNGLTGDGNINNTAGGASILTVGFDNSSSVFSGTISNTSGTVGFDKVGTGTLTLSGSSSYAGPSIVDAGTVFANNPNAIGTGGSVLTVNGGLLSLGASVTVAGLYGNAGAIANAAGAGANVITVLNTSTNGSVISDGGSGTVGIFLAAGALRLNGANTYSGGTRLATGTTLAFGNVGQAGSGLVSVSNNCVVHMPTTGSPIPAVNANYVTADNSIGTFLSGTTGNSFNGQFNGSASATNMMAGTFSLGGQYSFSNFFGTVIVSNGASIRTFLGNGGVGGGDNTLFDLRGSIFHRDDSTMLLGALTGDGSIGGASVATNAGTYTYWVIGSKGLSTVYSGFISGNNRIAKTGVGTLTLNGVTVTTNTVTMPDSSTIDVAAYAPRITYAGMTTVSNGALRVSVPNTLTNGTGLTLAGASAVFDASAMGYISNQTALDISATEVVTNSFFVTNGILEVVTGQQLNGTGTIRGSVVLDADSTNTIGVSTGTLSVTNAVTMNGAVVNMDLNRTNAQISDQIAAGGAITVNGGTLNVTNLGPVLQTGDVFHLFNKARVGSGFATLNLPVSGLDPSNNVVTYVWTNKLAVNGTIEVLSGYVPPVTTSSNADLANLVLTPAGALSPAFNSNTLSYTATEAYANSAVTVTPTAADAGATIQVIYGGATNSVASGSPSGSLALNASPLVTNPVEVRVTAADATTVKSYTVNVTRQPSTSPTTLARTVGGGNLTFTWPLDHTGWTLQTQTNTRAQGLKSNWFDVSGSTVTNQMIIPVSVSEQTVFFRLFYFAP